MQVTRERWELNLWDWGRAAPWLVVGAGSLLSKSFLLADGARGAKNPTHVSGWGYIYP